MRQPDEVRLSPAVSEWLRAAKATPGLARRFKKAQKAIGLMRDVGPHHAGFNTHPMKTLLGPDGRTIFNSYVENHTPGAWRMYWVWWDESRTIVYVVSIGPHDHTPGKQPRT